jgi:hypothetical protein
LIVPSTEPFHTIIGHRPAPVVSTTHDATMATAAALRELIVTFNDLNNSDVDELDDEPSPLEFMRYVARNTPFVIRGGASSWKASQIWNAEYLKSALSGQTVNVAVTPCGNADAPTFSSHHETTVISKPHEEDQPFHEFLNYVIEQETKPDFDKNSEVRYAQTRKWIMLLYDSLNSYAMSNLDDIQRTTTLEMNIASSLKMHKRTFLLLG